MWVNIFEADTYDEEALIKVVTSLTVDDMTKQIRQGELMISEWLHSQMIDAEFRVIVQGRRIGVQNDGIIDVFKESGKSGKLVWMPGD